MRVRGTAGLTQLSLTDSSHIAQVMFGAVPLPSLRKVSVADGPLLPQTSHIKGCGQTSVKPRGRETGFFLLKGRKEYQATSR